MKLTKALLALALTFALTGMGPTRPSPPQNIRAIWLSFPWWNLPFEKKKSVVQYLAQNKINQVYLSVYDSGISRWGSKVLKDAGIAEPQNPESFAEGVKLFRDQGIRVAAFFESGLMIHLHRPFPEQHPEWMQKCGDTHKSGEHGGNVMSFIDPSQKEPRELLMKALEELAAHPLKFEEIQLDRMRYTRTPGWEICKAADGTTNPEHVNAFVKEAYMRIKDVNPAIAVSASPVGSYGSWKHNQRWGLWVQGGYMDHIATQAYIPPRVLDECKRGTPITPLRQQTLAVFKAELATLSGQPALMEEAVAELQKLGGDPAVLDLERRRPMVQARAKELEALSMEARKSVVIGVAAHRFDDSECILDQLKLAREMGFNNASLWVSGVGPKDDGSPNPEIADNLSLLNETLWKDAR